MGLILVDSSVWIDILHARTTLQTMAFRQLTLAGYKLVAGDLILAEVLQGARSEDAAAKALSLLGVADAIAVSDAPLAIEAARHYRFLRARGITPRKTIDTLIATRCIVDSLPLLYSDRDFDPFVEHLGLRSALDLSGVT